MRSEFSLEVLVEAGGPILFLDRIADPGNAGTIIRTAEWFGLAGVALSTGSVDLYNPKLVRATMGAIFRLPIVESVDPADLRLPGLPIVALDADADEYLGTVELPRHAVYVVGSEAHGLDVRIRSTSRMLAIGGRGDGESLNAAVAAAVLCYELSRS
jgi:TrmH family RNA methyltransferase